MQNKLLSLLHGYERAERIVNGIHHCHSEHLFLLNVRVAPPKISPTPSTGATPGRQSNYSSLDTPA